MRDANTPDDDGDEDLFAAIRRERAPAPPGEYAGELMVAVPFTTAKTRGVAAFIKIYDLVQPNRLVEDTVPRARAASVDRIIANNGDVLIAWRATIGDGARARSATALTACFKALGKGQGRSCCSISESKSPNSNHSGDENILLGVRRGYPF